MTSRKSPEQAKDQALHWKELHGLADVEEGAGHFDEAEAYRMQAADIELDLAEAGFTISQLATS